MPSAILLLVGLVAASPGAAQAPERVELVFLDVGQGDATLIRSADGKAALVDAGPTGGDVVGQLAELGIAALDLAVASHADADHIGGMAAVLRRFPVRAYLDNDTPHTTATYRTLMQVVEQSDAIYLRPEARLIELGSVQLQVLPPPASARDQNDRSVGLLLRYGDFRALFAGDAEVDELSHFLKLGLPQVTVLKASHHGARNGVSRRWVEQLRPRVVVISVGAGNTYGHPNPRALRSYGAVAQAIYRTDVHGRIVIRGSYDGTYEVETEHVGR